MSKDSSRPTKKPTQWYTLPLRVFLWGMAITALFMIVLTVMAVALQQPECPADYAQQLVDASNCRIGADMSFVAPVLVGGSLLFMTLVVSGVVAVVQGVLALRRRRL